MDSTNQTTPEASFLEEYHDDDFTKLSTAPTLKLTPYRELKDKYVGAVGSASREQFDKELAEEINQLK